MSSLSFLWLGFWSFLLQKETTECHSVSKSVIDYSHISQIGWMYYIRHVTGLLWYTIGHGLDLPVSVTGSAVGSEAVVFPSVPWSRPVDPSIELSASELPPEKAETNLEPQHAKKTDF